MAGNHTTGKLHIEAHTAKSPAEITPTCDFSICSESGAALFFEGNTNLNAAADARRLVACWNACEGIDTEMLEAVSTDRQFWPIQMEKNSRRGLVSLLGIQNFTVQALKKEVQSETKKKLKAQRDELMDALKRLLSESKNPTQEINVIGAQVQARIAIEKVEGGAP